MHSLDMSLNKPGLVDVEFFMLHDPVLVRLWKG
jgi:hypothetical protein